MGKTSITQVANDLRSRIETTNDARLRVDPSWHALQVTGAEKFELIRFEEALLWILDTTFGRETFSLPKVTPKTLHVALARVYERVRDDLHLNTKLERLAAWDDLFNALCFGTTCKNLDTFGDHVRTNQSTIFARYATLQPQRAIA